MADHKQLQLTVSTITTKGILKIKYCNKHASKHRTVSCNLDYRTEILVETMTNEEQEMDEVVVVAQPLQHNIKNCVPPPLSTNTIISAIDAECTKSSSSALSLPQIRWRRHQYENHHQGQQDHPSSLLYTIVGELKEDDNTRARTTVATTTFYFAYSTWDGRILYVDHIHLDDAIVIAEQQPTQHIMTTYVYHILANITIALHCCRYELKPPV